MVHYVFWLFSGGAPANQPASQGGGGFQSLPATQPRLGAAPTDSRKEIVLQLVNIRRTAYIILRQSRTTLTEVDHVHDGIEDDYHLHGNIVTIVWPYLFYVRWTRAYCRVHTLAFQKTWQVYGPKMAIWYLAYMENCATCDIGLMKHDVNEL